MEGYTLSTLTSLAAILPSSVPELHSSAGERHVSLHRATATSYQPVAKPRAQTSHNILLRSH